MSLLAILRKKFKRDLFTTPSHAQEFFIFPKLRQFYKFDISETDTHQPQKALDEAEKKAAKIYGTKSTHFLLNGSSSGIIAAVLACVQKDEKVLIWDNAHPSHLNAVKLAGAEPVFYELKKDENWGIFGATPVEILENKLKEHNISSLSQPSPLGGKCAFERNASLSQPSPLGGEGEFLGEFTNLRNSGEGYIKAVIVTSPSYEGVVSDIKKIKEICKKYETFLIVDEAHGALYPFCDKLPSTAIEQGADFIIQSLHKTAGGLNPTALLHCNLDEPLTPNPSPPRGEGRIQFTTSTYEKIKEEEDFLSQPSPLGGKCDFERNTSLSQPSPLVGEGEFLGEFTSLRNSGEGSNPQLSMSVNQALDMINTTSPSYPLLASIEKNINFLNSQKGRKNILVLVENIEKIKKKLPNIEFYKDNDNTKILIKGLTPRPLRERAEFQGEGRALEIRVRGMSGYDLSQYLYDHGIEDERTNEKSTMLLCGIGTSLKKLKRLEKVLKKL